MMSIIKNCLTTTYSKFKTCIKRVCKLFTRKKYIVLEEEDSHYVDFPDEDVIEEQKVIEEQETIYDQFPIATERL